MERIELACLVVLEYYGPVVGKVFAAIAGKGKIPLRLIHLSSGLPKKKVKESLVVLVHHNIVLAYEGDGTPPLYEGSLSDAIMIMRWMKLSNIARAKFGDGADTIIEELLQNGRLNFVEIISKSMEATPQQAGMAGKLSKAFAEQFETMVCHNYIIRADPPKLISKSGEISAPVKSLNGTATDEQFRLPAYLLDPVTNSSKNKSDTNNNNNVNNNNNSNNFDNSDDTNISKAASTSPTEKSKGGEKGKSKEKEITHKSRKRKAGESEEAASTSSKSHNKKQESDEDTPNPKSRKRKGKTEPDDNIEKPKRKRLRKLKEIIEEELVETGTVVFTNSVGQPSKTKETDDRSTVLSEENSNPTIWRVNYDKFLSFLRNEQIIDYARQKSADGYLELLRCIMRIAERYIRSRREICTKSLTMEEIMLEVNASDKARTTESDVKSLIDHLSRDRPALFQQSSTGGYTMNLGMVAEKIRQREIESIIFHKFGENSLRIFRMVMIKKYVEHNKVHELARMPEKEANQRTLELYNKGYITLQDIPKVGVPYYLYHVDPFTVCDLVTEAICKGLRNLKTRQMLEIEKYREIAIRVEANGGDEGMSDYEKGVYNQYQAIEDKLGASIARLDDSLIKLTEYSST